jgi:hypothetical protein
MLNRKALDHDKSQLRTGSQILSVKPIIPLVGLASGPRMRRVNGRGYSVQSASGSGRIWKWTTLGLVPFPVSLWNGVRVPHVVQTPFPFQPVFGSSKRPSIPLA